MLYKDGKPFAPDINDFISAFNFYGEMEFTLSGRDLWRRGVANVGVEFSNLKTGDCQIFENIEEFRQKAKIGGVLLKDLWDKVTNL